VVWLEQHDLLTEERGGLLRRRAQLQPAGATAALLEARRVRAALGLLATNAPAPDRGRQVALTELNRILGRSAGMRQIEQDEDGTFRWHFEPAGDAFAGLLLPLVESATESLIAGELPRVKRCAAAGCRRAFLDGTKNGSRKWCAMARCGNREKQRGTREGTREGTRGARE
jgi:predicted RNA-binding Zn ribbon-like protein